MQETGVDWLSVACGNIHGAIAAGRKDKKPEARLDIEHLELLAEAAGVPLVLHGGSGIQQESFLAAVLRGIAKINVGTDIRQPYEVKLRETGDIAAAQEVVYQRTRWLIREFFGWTGTAKVVTLVTAIRRFEGRR